MQHKSQRGALTDSWQLGQLLNGIFNGGIKHIALRALVCHLENILAKQIPEGILLLDKPKGPTSFDMVAQTRRLFGTKSVGHTGTLDPFATGLLVLLLGRYTRLCDYLTAQDKTYEAEICFGVGTDTDDCEGQVIATADASHLTPELINTALKSFLGEQLQVPPQYSAISLNGERAYKKARRGEVIEMPARPMTVYEILPISPDSRRIRLSVSKGTYIRAIARDLGAKLGVPAHLTNLRRMASGLYHVSEASGELKTGIKAIRGIPLISIDRPTAEALKKGQKPAFVMPAQSGIHLAHLGDDPVALVKIEQGRLVPVRGF